MGKFIDITGQTFGRLVAIRRKARLEPGHTKWECSCICGRIIDVDISNLRDGRSQSCGCAKSYGEDKRRCYICKQVLPLIEFANNVAEVGGKAYNCKLCQSAKSMTSNNKSRREVILHYGGKCACCGFDDLDKKVNGMSFLHIDHTNGNGRQLRKKNKKHASQIVSILKRQGYPDGYRILCGPCNIAMLPGDTICELHKWEQTNPSNFVFKRL